MSNLKSPSVLKSAQLIWCKGMLFVILGLTASALLLFEVASLRLALLHALAVWAFCRAYYFAFYVIQHYVDSSYRFAGLMDFVRYSLWGSNLEGQGRLDAVRERPPDQP